MTTARSELILGGQKSGKSRRAENLAQEWLTQAVLPSMQERRWGRIVNLSGSMEPRSLNAASAARRDSQRVSAAPGRLPRTPRPPLLD